ncbi:MAG: SPOR domain-containing protein [Bacteroidota bacterium]
MYVKNPLSLRAEFENYQDQIKDLKRRNKELMNQASETQSSDAVDSLRWALIQSEGELEALRTQNQQFKKQYGTQKVVNDMGIPAGLIYRIQIGAFVFYQMDSKGSSSSDFLAERSDGFNKYMIGAFRTYDEASEFKDELKKLGLDNPFVVPYIDGVRVTVDEANQYLQRQESQANFLDN